LPVAVAIIVGSELNLGSDRVSAEVGISKLGQAVVHVDYFFSTHRAKQWPEIVEVGASAPIITYRCHAIFTPTNPSHRSFITLCFRNRSRGDH
jgi:hypothetical protein